MANKETSYKNRWTALKAVATVSPLLPLATFYYIVGNPMNGGVVVIIAGGVLLSAFAIMTNRVEKMQPEQS